MLLVIDNYDSFVYNLVQYFGELGQKTAVFRNDAVTADEVENLNPKAVVLSPGPGRPEQAGVCAELVRRFCGRIPVLGVCLGHQVIAQVFGAAVQKSPTLMHGKSSAIIHRGCGLFKGLPVPFRGGRYHSLAVSPANLPEQLEVTAWTEDGIIMGLCHRRYAVYGVQFHPESVLTGYGHQLLNNFIQLAG